MKKRKNRKKSTIWDWTPEKTAENKDNKADKTLKILYYINKG
jgi:hypothetical protein